MVTLLHLVTSLRGDAGENLRDDCTSSHNRAHREIMVHTHRALVICQETLSRNGQKCWPSSPGESCYLSFPEPGGPYWMYALDRK